MPNNQKLRVATACCQVAPDRLGGAGFDRPTGLSPLGAFSSPSTASPIASGLRRANIQLSGARPTTRVRPTANHAERQPHTADSQFREQRLGDQAEALRASGQGADHRGRRQAQHHPAVVDARPVPNHRRSTTTFPAFMTHRTPVNSESMLLSGSPSTATRSAR